MAGRNPNCLFCSIAAGDIPATIVRQNDDVVVFRDLNPQAPIHVLVIPRDHYPNAGVIGEEAPELAAAMLAEAAAFAVDEGLGDGYRIVFNTGRASGQTVYDAHAHVLGGRQLTWPPGGRRKLHCFLRRWHC